jgi:protein-L-isoaspartate(D-aspartate) O-methyltransferase
MNLESARQQMIGQQLRAWGVLDDRVLEVMAMLPRELFVPAQWRQLAYADTAIPIGAKRELSPPKIQGRALQATLPQPGDNVLEIGTGTGYLTACLACLGGRVTGVESDPALAEAARRNLSALMLENAEVVIGDGLAMEFPADYDVICLNGSVPAPPERLLRRLRTGGRMFVVKGAPPVMEALKITRTGDSEWATEGLFETVVPALEGLRLPEEFVF